MIKSEIYQRLELIERLYSLSEKGKWLLLQEYILFFIDWGWDESRESYKKLEQVGEEFEVWEAN